MTKSNLSAMHDVSPARNLAEVDFNLLTEDVLAGPLMD